MVVDEINGYGLEGCNNLQCPFYTYFYPSTWVDQRGLLGAIENHTRYYKNTHVVFIRQLACIQALKPCVNRHY